MGCLRGGKMKFNQKQIIGLIYQLMFSVATIIVLVFSLIEREFQALVNLMLAFLMFGMAYNNFQIYHRRYFTAIYLIIAVACLLLVLM